MRVKSSDKQANNWRFTWLSCRNIRKVKKQTNKQMGKLATRIQKCTWSDKQAYTRRGTSLDQISVRFPYGYFWRRNAFLKQLSIAGTDRNKNRIALRKTKTEQETQGRRKEKKKTRPRQRKQTRDHMKQERELASIAHVRALIAIFLAMASSRQILDRAERQQNLEWKAQARKREILGSKEFKRLL